MGYQVKANPKNFSGMIKVAHLISIPEPNAIPEDLLKWFVSRWGKSVDAEELLLMINSWTARDAEYIQWFLKVGIIEPVEDKVQVGDYGNIKIEFYDKTKLPRMLDLLAIVEDTSNDPNPLVGIRSADHIYNAIKKDSFKKCKNQALAKQAFEILKELCRQEKE